MSLQEQRTAIENYAQRYGLAIAQWFEERESAAKRGRPVFTQMMRQAWRVTIRPNSATVAHDTKLLGDVFLGGKRERRDVFTRM